MMSKQNMDWLIKYQEEYPKLIIHSMSGNKEAQMRMGELEQELIDSVECPMLRENI